MLGPQKISECAAQVPYRGLALPMVGVPCLCFVPTDDPWCFRATQWLSSSLFSLALWPWCKHPTRSKHSYDDIDDIVDIDLIDYIDGIDGIEYSYIDYVETLAAGGNCKCFQPCELLFVFATSDFFLFFGIFLASWRTRYLFSTKIFGVH